MPAPPVVPTAPLPLDPRPAPIASTLAPPWRRVADRLDLEGRALPLDELALQLFALRTRPDPALGRRLLAPALGLPEAALPPALDLRMLPRLAAGPVAGVPLEAAEWVVVDLETTGLSGEDCTILEIGAVRIAGLRLVERFQTLVDPGRPIPPRITALTGIDRTLVDGAPALPRAIRAFRDWAGAGQSAVFVAHNASFDERFVRSAFAAHALPPWGGPVVCTRKVARRLLPELRHYDLDTLAGHFGIANRARHRALGDAEATARALVELLEIGREARALRTLGDLLALQAEPASRRRGRRRRPPPEPARP